MVYDVGRNRRMDGRESSLILSLEFLERRHEMKRLLKGTAAVLAAAALTLFGTGMKDAAPVAQVSAAGNTYTVSVASGYLALRTYPAFDSSNEVGQLYNGDTVTVQEYTSGGYWWVYSPKYDRCGYVNNDYLVAKGGSSSSSSLGTYTVSVSSGYLALRTAPSYDAANEIGQLYSGDTVDVKEKSTDKYWLVYSPKYGKTGYVNRSYLIGAGSSSVGGKSYTVKLDAGYLALRSSMVFTKDNEIGKLYNGDTVNLQEKSSDTYWYVYSPKLDCYGYVNKKYLDGATGGIPSSYIAKMTVSVKKGYLALRSKAVYDSSNEIGELYTGDVVYVTEKGSKYYYVYSPKYEKYGYVNKSYLY